MVQYIFTARSPSTNCTLSPEYQCKTFIVDWVYSQVIWLQLVWSRKLHSIQELITYDNVHHLWSTSGNQIQVGALGDNASVVDSSNME